MNLFAFIWAEQDAFANHIQTTVVFVIDTSESMTRNDPNRMMYECVSQAVYSLPSHYDVGIVSYSTEAIVMSEVLDFTRREELLLNLQNLSYAGYTNAGAGLGEALELLSTTADETEETHIIMISDGEITMPTSAKTLESVELFQNGIAHAVDEEIKVHVVALGEAMQSLPMETPILSETLKTEGTQRFISGMSELPYAMETILSEGLDVKHQTLSLLQSDGELSVLPLSLPEFRAKRMKLLIKSSGTLANLTAEFSAKEVRQYAGQQFAILEFEELAEKDVTLQWQSQVSDTVKVTSLAEYEIDTWVHVDYIDTPPEDEKGEYYERIAEVKITFVDPKNQNILLFEDVYFNNQEVLLLLGENSFVLPLKNGQIVYECVVEEHATTELQLDMSFDFSKMPIYVTNIVTAQLLLETPPEFIQEVPYILYAFLVGSAVLFLLVMIRKPSQKEETQNIAVHEPPKERTNQISTEKSEYNYVGRLLIHITKTSTNRDLPPLTFELFQVTKSQISLQEIFDKLHIAEDFLGAEHIFFKSAPHKSLLLTNQSNSTILKERNILLKNETYTIPLHSELEILFEDERCEILLQYKEQL